MAAENGNGRNWPMTIAAGVMIAVLGAMGVRFWSLPEEITAMSADIRIISERLADFRTTQSENQQRILDLERGPPWRRGQ